MPMLFLECIELCKVYVIEFGFYDLGNIANASSFFLLLLWFIEGLHSI